MARLGDIIEQIRGVSYKPSDLSDKLDENSVILLRANNIQGGKLVFDDVLYVSKSKVNKNQYLKQGDILVCTSSGSKEVVGKAAYIEKDLPMVFGAFCKVVRPNAHYRKYIGYFFQSPYYRKTISAVSAGANINNLRNEHIANLNIPLPSLEEQRRIAATLDKVTDLISKRRQQLDKLDELVKARFVEMFGDPATNPMGWERGTIRDVVTEVKYGTSKPAVEGGTYKYLRMGNITYDGHLDLTDLKYIDIPDSELDKCAVKKGDVLFNRTNSKELVGKTCVYNLDETMVIAGYIIRVRVNNRVLPEYLSAVLNSSYGKKTLAEMCKAIVGQANINAQELQNIQILIPPIELQHKFLNVLRYTEKISLPINQSCDKLETLKKALMQEYFG